MVFFGHGCGGCYATLQQETLIVKQGRNDSWAGAAAAAGDTGIWRSRLSGDSGLPMAIFPLLIFHAWAIATADSADERGYRQLSRYQQQLLVERLLIAQQIGRS